MVTSHEGAGSQTAAAPRVIGREVAAMFSSIASRYDITNSVLSGGIHHWWKRQAVERIPSTAQRVLDLCTGTGDLVPLIQRAAASAGTREVVGADFCEPMLEVARKRFPSAPFVFADAMNLQFESASFDAATVAFGVRNFEDLDRGLTEIARVLKPGGALVILEFGQPPNRVFRSVYNWYSRVILPHIGRLLTGNGAAYEYLPETAARFPCGAELAARLHNAGFSSVEWKPLTFGIAYLYWAEKIKR